MKEKVIETCGKIWHELGSRGRANVDDLSDAIKEDEEMVNLALGWLAREDKIECAPNRHGRMFSLVESELKAFRSVYGDVKPRKRSIWSRLLR